MLYLFLATTFSSCNALIIKYCKKKSNNEIAVLMINYIVATVFGISLMRTKLFDAVASGETTLFIFALIDGILFISTFVLLQMNIKKNGATVSGSMTHMGMFITVLLSILIFHETTNLAQIIGIAVSFVTLIVIAWPKSMDMKMESRWLLIPMVVAGGIGDMMSKFFEVYCNHEHESVFVCLTFFVAQIICIALCVIKGERINKYDVGCGIALGIANYLSTDLLIRSIYMVPAYMAYIIFGFGVILIVNFVNLAVMHEQLSRKDYLGMAMAVVAIILLNI